MEYMYNVCWNFFPVSGLCEQFCWGYITMGRFPHHGRTSFFLSHFHCRTSFFLSPFHSPRSRWTYLAPASWWVARGQLPRRTSTPWPRGWWNRTCWGSWSGTAASRMVSSTRSTGTAVTGDFFLWNAMRFFMIPFLCSEESQAAFGMALDAITGR